MVRETRTLLLVDPSASSLFYWGMLLKRLEYRVVTTRSGEEALTRLDAAKPSVILAEAVLPDMSGADLLKRLREDDRSGHVPVVMLCEQDSAAEREACTRRGCAAWFTKTVEPQTLYAALQELSEAAPRHHIRLKTSLKVIVGDGSVAGGAERTEYAMAISEGGLYVRTLYPQPKDVATPVRFSLNGSEIRAKATVLYSTTRNDGPYREPGMGMRFMNLSERDRNAVRLFIKEQLTRDIAS